MEERIILSQRQWEVMNFFKDTKDTAWIGALNKRVINALIKKRLLKLDERTGNVSITNYGKSIKI